MKILQLQPHPTTPCSFIDSLTVTIERKRDGVLRCRYELRGDIERLAIPLTSLSPTRTDGLWRHTCFELFARTPESHAYSEFNFSPSGDWAAYRFDSYRHGMAELPLTAAPSVAAARRAHDFILIATLDDPRPAQLALSAVLEDGNGEISYWALQHPDGKPDFHHDAGFAALLEN
jgi:hypothetical protein